MGLSARHLELLEERGIDAEIAAGRGDEGSAMHGGDHSAFWDHVWPEPNSGCWLWSGSHDRRGYGRFSYALGGGLSRRVLAHRFVLELLKGPIPSSLDVDHRCRNTACVNPEHLEPVSRRENILRGEGHAAKNARKTHCIHGHPLSGENLIAEPRANGKVGRRCRLCRNRRALESYWRRRGNQC